MRKPNTKPVKTWKDKILDYEIETFLCFRMRSWTVFWKDKILDYEIETVV